MEGAKNVDENLVNHAESEGHAESVADPVNVERGGIIVPKGRKYGGESDQLDEDVAEEILEFAIKAALQHKGGDSHLKDRVGDPERVIENFDFLAHHLAGRQFKLCGWLEVTLAVSAPLFNALK